MPLEAPYGAHVFSHGRKPVESGYAISSLGGACEAFFSKVPQTPPVGAKYRATINHGLAPRGYNQTLAESELRTGGVNY